jgi:ribosome biogenesis protein Nip4
MEQINDFITRFGASVTLDENLVIENENRYFLLNSNLEKLISEGFYHAGFYLGKIKKRVFFPSFMLLAMIAEGDANRIMVDKKTEWLFICGRDVFRQGIVSVADSKKKSDYVLVMNQHGECLGFGKILHNLEETNDKRKVAVKNISDIGDFLRRERQGRQ